MIQAEINWSGFFGKCSQVSLVNETVSQSVL